MIRIVFPDPRKSQNLLATEYIFFVPLPNLIALNLCNHTDVNIMLLMCFYINIYKQTKKDTYNKAFYKTIPDTHSRHIRLN